MRRALALVALLVTPALADDAPDAGAAAPVQATIDVDVTGLRDGGSVWVLLFNDAKAYPTKRDKALRRLDAVPDKGRARVSFEGLAPGEYAVAVVHDENGNGKVDTNFIGIPREGLGASRDPRSTFGPPSFRDAAFRVTPGRTTIPVPVRY